MHYQVTPNDINKFITDNSEHFKNLVINTLPLDNEISIIGKVPNDKQYNYTLTVNNKEKPLTLDCIET